MSNVDNDRSRPATDAELMAYFMRTIENYSARSSKDMETINKLMRHIFKLIKVPNMFGDVSKFIEACDQPKSEENAQLYHSLIVEEFNELEMAYHRVDRVEELDACMDMIWVILGYCYMNDWDVVGAWHEVARSNLSKINPETGKVIKREDGKVLKPEGWIPPQLEQFTK